MGALTEETSMDDQAFARVAMLVPFWESGTLAHL